MSQLNLNRIHVIGFIRYQMRGSWFITFIWLHPISDAGRLVYNINLALSRFHMRRGWYTTLSWPSPDCGEDGICIALI